MSAFVYIVTEGVHDVAFLAKILKVCWGAVPVETKEDLDEPRQVWLSSFKWPARAGATTPIRRLSVPAPVFYRVPAGPLLAFRNAQGISGIKKTLEVDLEAFGRDANGPSAIGVVLDNDDKAAAVRFREAIGMFKALDVEGPVALGQVSDGTPRVGVFAFPEPGREGTLEDVLQPLGKTAYPDLFVAASEYAARWRKAAEDEQDVPHWKEILKPAGEKKAAIGAMVAVLKPGRPTQASIEDHGWVSDATRSLPGLQPCIAFLDSLLAGTVATQRNAP
jgi:hypothetical protein